MRREGAETEASTTELHALATGHQGTTETADPPIERLDAPPNEPDEEDGGDHRLHGQLSKSPADGRSRCDSQPQPENENECETQTHRVLPHRREESLIAPPTRDVPDVFTDDEGDPLPIEAARNTYRRLVGSRLAEGNPTKIADAKERCRKLLQADRVLQGEWELTTVLLTLRPRPLDDHGRLITPTLVADAVRTARDAYPFADSLRYQLKGRRDEPLNYEYATVMAGTEHWATPHLHAYLWVDDGDNVLSGETLAPVLSQLIEDCPHARPQDHFIHEGAEVGAVTIQHDPDLATNSEYGGDKYEDRPVTRGAKYLATQLPHFAMKGAMDGPDPPDYEIDAAVTAWSLGGDHVTTSGGIKQTTDVLVG